MYRVDWLDSCLNELAAVWLAADSPTRDRIRNAVSSLEDHLRHDPSAVGESREGNERVAFFEPLGVSVELDAAARIVTVLHIWRVRRH